MVSFCSRIAASSRFQTSILWVIVFNAGVMGLETSHALSASYGRLFEWLNTFVQAVYVAELMIRLAAHAPRVFRFFRDGWNVFDFIVISASLFPAVGPFATVVRLARILRISRILSLFPDLRLVVATLLRSIPSMGHILLLLALLFYVYGVLGFSAFHTYDPEHWGTLGISMRTLFQILTFEGWPTIQEATLITHPWSWIYFFSFIVIGVYVVVNLFVAVIIDNLLALRAEQIEARHGRADPAGMLKSIDVLKAELSRLELQVRANTR